MKLTNFNRSLSYLLFLTSVGGAYAQQSPDQLVIDKANPSTTAVITSIASSGTVAEPDTEAKNLATQAAMKAILQTLAAQNPVGAQITKTAPKAVENTEPNPQAKRLAARAAAHAIVQETVVKANAETVAADAAAKAVDADSAVKYTVAATASKHKPHLNSNSLWKRLFSLYAIPEIDNPRIEQEVQNFLRNPRYLTAIQQRAEPYLYLILEEIEAKNLPGELALLPMIESAFRTDARSPMEASGLWQFMPATGLSFGLKQNRWYDGRRDVYASTEAATSYLKQLNEMMGGNWLLTLASYNFGIGNVQKAMRRNEEQALDADYWSLNLPKETMDYVPKLLAIAKLFAHAEEYNLELKNIPNQPFLKMVNIDMPLDFDKAAELAGMPTNEFKLLNPGFKHKIIAQDGSYQLLIQAKNAATFNRKLAKLPQADRLKWIKHTIKPGEDLGSIAKMHAVSVESLVEINQLKDYSIEIGSVLRIPPRSAYPNS